MVYLGINWEQNSTAALIHKGRVLSCLSEERLSGVKNDERYPKRAIDCLLQNHGLSPSSVEAVVFVSNHWSPLYTLTRHYTTYTQKDYRREQYDYWRPRLLHKKSLSYLSVFQDKIDLDQYPGRLYWDHILKSTNTQDQHSSNSDLIKLGQSIRRDLIHMHLGTDKSKVFFADHSRSHEAYGYWSIPFRHRNGKRVLSLTLDAFGDGVNYSATLRSGDGTIIRVAQGNNFIIGRLYRYTTQILGFKPNEHEYKVMGMAPYCKEKYFLHIFEQLVKIQDVEGLDFVYNQSITDHYFHFKRLFDGERFDAICGALQAYTEYLITRWVQSLLETVSADAICISGGVAMNVKANMTISKTFGLPVFVPPSPDDSSQAMGALFHHLESTLSHSSDRLETAYLGRDTNWITATDIEASLINAGESRSKYIIREYDPLEVAQLLDQGRVIGRFVGREEFGARALGNRSIIASPRDRDTKKRINEMIKSRDFWMPFACSINEEYAERYLVLDSDIDCYRYMTLCCNTTPYGAIQLQAGIHDYDNTCRPQLVSSQLNPTYHSLISAYGARSGTHAVLNTSLNKHGNPVVGTLDDCIDILATTNLDAHILDRWFIMKVSSSICSDHDVITTWP